MEDYDVLFGLIIRLHDYTVDELDAKLEETCERLGDYISEMYPNIVIVPIAIHETTEEDDVYSILSEFRIFQE